MSASIWDVVAGASLSILLLATFFLGSWRVRRQVFVAFCFLALTAFAWHAGCWYHKLDCRADGQVTTLAQGL